MELKSEIIGLFFLNNLANKFEKNTNGLYRDNKLPLFKNINGHRVDEIRKECHELLTKNRLSLKIK